MTDNVIISRHDPAPLIAERDEFVRRANSILAQIDDLISVGPVAKAAWDSMSRHSMIGIYDGFRRGNLKKSPSAVIDGVLWVSYLELTGIWDHLPDRYRAQFVDWRNEQREEAAPFTTENVEAFIQQLHDTRWDWLSERILDAFGYASKDHKSNEPHRIGDKVILKGGFWHNQQRNVQNIESVVYHVMNDTVPVKGRLDTFRQAAGTTVENKYMKVKKFQNENVHITWTELGADAVRRMNEVLALGAERKLGRSA